MKVEVEVSDSAYAVASGVAKFVAAIVAEVKDNGGWDAGDDLPGIMTSSITDLLPAITAATDLGEELEENKVAFYKSMMIGLSDIADVFVKKEEA